MGAAVRLPRHPRNHLRRSRTHRPRPLTHLIHHRPGRGTRPGRRPGRFSPLTTHPVTSPLLGYASSRRWSTPAVSADPTPARPNAATPTPANEPTRACGHRHADTSPWPSCHYPKRPKLKVLGLPHLVVHMKCHVVILGENSQDGS